MIVNELSHATSQNLAFPKAMLNKQIFPAIFDRRSPDDDCY